MRKEELTGKVAAAAGITKAQAGLALNAIVEGIIEGVQSEEGKATLIGFGTFQRVHRAARAGVNPATGEKIEIKASNAVRFRPGSILKNTIK